MSGCCKADTRWEVPLPWDPLASGSRVTVPPPWIELPSLHIPSMHMAAWEGGR